MMYEDCMFKDCSQTLLRGPDAKKNYLETFSGPPSDLSKF